MRIDISQTFFTDLAHTQTYHGLTGLGTLETTARIFCQNSRLRPTSADSTTTISRSIWNAFMPFIGTLI